MIKLDVRCEGSCYTPTMTQKLWPAHDYSTVTCDHLLSNTVSSRKEKEIQHKYIQCGKEPRETVGQLNWLNQYRTTKRQELKSRGTSYFAFQSKHLRKRNLKQQVDLVVWNT